MSEWIKTADRKPEYGQVVIGVDRTGYVARFEYDDAMPPWSLDGYDGFIEENEIIAWMPLPVYEGEKE